MRALVSTKRGPADRSRISLLEPYEVQYWADKFGVSKERLSEAVRRIGHSADAPGTGRTQKPAEGAQGRTELGLRADEMLKEVAPCLTHVKNDGSERCGKSEQSLARSTYNSCSPSARRSSGGALVVQPWLRFHIIRLPESDSRFVNVGTDMVTFRWPWPGRHFFGREQTQLLGLHVASR